jgi:ABC-type molybdenum transport system ATPase subunit/photorepair protein PhrA
LTALISSDHPQSYSLPIKVFNKSRLPTPGEPGVSLFDLQKKIGFSSPELHAFFPKHLTIRQVLESAWAEAPLDKVELTAKIDDKVSAILRWFQGEICPELGPSSLFELESRGGTVNDSYVRNPIRGHSKQRAEEFRLAYFDPKLTSWADQRRFSEVAFPSQRLLLFLRAIVKSPDILVLDEPYSGLDAIAIQKCNAFLAHGETQLVKYAELRSQPMEKNPRPRRSDLDRLGLANFKGLTRDQALVFISHRKEEVPGVIREWLCLPEPGSSQAPRFGRFDGPLEIDPNRWRQVWGQSPLVSKSYRIGQTDEQKRLRYNAYHRNYRKKESPEQTKKRSDVMKLYRLRAGAGRMEEYYLSKFKRLSLPERIEKVLIRSYNTTKKTEEILAELGNVSFEKKISRNRRLQRLSTMSNRLITQSDHQLLAIQDVMKRIESRREEDQVQNLELEIEGRLAASDTHILRARRQLSKLHRQRPAIESILFEGGRLLQNGTYRLNRTSRYLETIKQSRDSAH